MKKDRNYSLLLLGVLVTALALFQSIELERERYQHTITKAMLESQKDKAAFEISEKYRYKAQCAQKR